MDEKVDVISIEGTQAAFHQNDDLIRTFVAVSSNLVYRMNADWTRMEQFIGKELVATTPEPITSWMNKYIPPEDQPRMYSAIEQAITAKSMSK